MPKPTAPFIKYKKKEGDKELYIIYIPLFRKGQYISKLEEINPERRSFVDTEPVNIRWMPLRTFRLTP